MLYLFELSVTRQDFAVINMIIIRFIIVLALTVVAVRLYAHSIRNHEYHLNAVLGAILFLIANIIIYTS